MEEELIGIKNAAVSLILDASDMQELEELKLQFLGKNGKLTLALKELGKIPKEKRPEVGALANDVKKIIEDTIATAEYKLQETHVASSATSSSIAESEHLDVTNPGIKPPLGHLHPITQAIQEITSIFEKIGFTRVRYPEVEWDYYGFSALNFPENHPARDDWETFFMNEPKHNKYGQVILTPHTSSGQVREMEKAVEEAKRTKSDINIRMLNIAKCYRRQSDVSHTAMFHQFETLVVGKDISISHLKGVLDYFVKSYFGPNRKARIRPYHFQFTEPSFETDVSCGVCDGKGCKLCKEGWLELGGAGMVHPNVLKAGGIDPTEYTGFASGWGVERVLMMKEGLEIDDLRLLYSNKLEFLEQF
jgi:phenylalanyl-tRNA synthetase alpha chain